MRGITKRFPGVLANDDVSFEVAAGEVHALLGENGAGKTTLMNILTGLYRPDEGEIEIGGQAVELHSPRDAINAGIGMVHQHFRLVDTLTVAENVVLGSRADPFLVRRNARAREVEAIADALRMPVDPDAKIWQLSVGEQQRVEIMKAVRSGSQVLILDEPTAVLTPQEARRALPHDPRHGGRRALGDRDHAQVARGSRCLRPRHRPPWRSVGRQPLLTAGATPPVARSVDGRARHRGGRDVAEGASRAGEVMLELDGVTAHGDRGGEALRSVSPRRARAARCSASPASPETDSASSPRP